MRRTRAAIVAIAALAAPACTPTSRPEASPEPAAPDEPALDAPSPVAVAPPVAAPASLGPGHYAAWIDYENHSSCSQSWSVYHTRSSFVLDLAPDETVRACRGRQMHDRGGGWGEKTNVLDMREQQGFSGRWHRDGEWIDVELALDDVACPTTRGWVNREPQPWHLRCMTPDPQAHPNLPPPVLACQFAEPAYTEGLSYAVSGLLPDGEWIILGPGDGVEVQAGYDELEGSYAEIRLATSPVFDDAWTGDRAWTRTPSPALVP